MSQMTMYEGINNSPITVLDGDLSASATTIPVVAGSAFPAPPSLCTIGTEENAELVLYTGISNSQLTGCTRGFNGTTAKAWADGTSVYRAISEYDQQAIQHNIRDHEERMAQTEQSMRSAASPVIGAASGNPVVIPDAAGERVLRSVKVSIEPVQEGSGDPAPDNVRPITGWTGAKVTRCGKNMMTEPYDVTKPAGYPGGWNGTAVDADGVVTQTDYNIARGGFGGVVVYGIPAGTYTLSFDADYSGVSTANCAISILARYRGASEHIQVSFFNNVRVSRPSIAVTLDSYAEWVAFRLTGGAGSASDSVFRYSHIQLEPGSAATDYEPYSGETFDVTFPSEAGTVYEGTLDVPAGELVATYRGIVLTGDENWALSMSSYNNSFYITNQLPGAVAYSKELICSHYPAKVKELQANDNVYIESGRRLLITANNVEHTIEAWKAYLRAQVAAGTPVTVVYKSRAGSEQNYSLTPEQIAVPEGFNIIRADCGPVEAEWVRDTGAAIEAANADTRGMVGEASGETASRSLAVGEYVTVGDKLYKVTSAVGTGETLVPGSNVTETTVGAELTALYNLINS